MSAIRFPAEYLELARVEEHTRPGVVQVDNDAGGFGILMANSRRRIGQEGERVHVATLYFNVREVGRDAGKVGLRFEPFGNFFNWLVVWHRNGTNASELPITVEVTPLVVTDALLRMQADPTTLGDVNLDYEVDISDAINLLGTLFVGNQLIACPEAADFNEDHSVNISDPVAILNWLFRSGSASSGREILCGSD